jgi:hypothetical protein
MEQSEEQLAGAAPRWPSRRSYFRLGTAGFAIVALLSCLSSTGANLYMTSPTVTAAQLEGPGASNDTPTADSLEVANSSKLWHRLEAACRAAYPPDPDPEDDVYVEFPVSPLYAYRLAGEHDLPFDPDSFELPVGADDGEGEPAVMAESQGAPETPQPKPAGTAPVYAVKGSPIYIVVAGYDMAEEPTLRPTAEVFLTAIDNGETATILDRRDLWGAEMEGFELVDLLSDGRKQLVACSSPAAGCCSTGEVIGITPAGMFDIPWGLRGDGQLSAYEGISLLDYDGDGHWELEESQRLGGLDVNYTFRDLWTFDPATNQYVRADALFPQYYEDQRKQFKGIYKELLAEQKADGEVDNELSDLLVAIWQVKSIVETGHP